MTCPICGNPCIIDRANDGSEHGARCTECRWSVQHHQRPDLFDNPWQRSSPETVSCRHCGADIGSHGKVHAPGCPWRRKAPERITA